MNLTYSDIDLYIQKYLVESKFCDFKTEISGAFLIINGNLKNEDWEFEYKIQVIYNCRNSYQVSILNPNVIKHPDLHINENGVLCLHYPPNISKFKNFWVVDDLIYQTIKWIHCYELWKINGHEWKCPETPHGLYDIVSRWQN